MAIKIATDEDVSTRSIHIDFFDNGAKPDVEFTGVFSKREIYKLEKILLKAFKLHIVNLQKEGVLAHGSD